MEEITHMDIMEIMTYLRNRYPLLFIDYAEHIVPGKSARAFKNVTYNEAYFQGHFPDNPTVPGIYQLESMFQTAALAVHTMPGNQNKTSYISKAKEINFRDQVRPGDCMQIDAFIESYRRGVAKATATIFCREKLVSEAQFTLVIPEDMILK